MDINLEKFTNESENIAEKIYKFCDLKWNKKNLEFYKRNDLFSKTISFSQIRNKISKYDSTKYKPYIDLIKDETKQNEWLKI